MHRGDVGQEAGHAEHAQEAPEGHNFAAHAHDHDEQERADVHTPIYISYQLAAKLWEQSLKGWH